MTEQIMNSEHYASTNEEAFGSVFGSPAWCDAHDFLISLTENGSSIWGLSRCSSIRRKLTVKRPRSFDLFHVSLSLQVFLGSSNNGGQCLKIETVETWKVMWNHWTGDARHKQTEQEQDHESNHFDDAMVGILRGHKVVCEEKVRPPWKVKTRTLTTTAPTSEEKEEDIPKSRWKGTVAFIIISDQKSSTLTERSTNHITHCCFDAIQSTSWQFHRLLTFGMKFWRQAPPSGLLLG